MFKKFRQYFAPDNGEIAGSADLPTDDVTDVALDEGTSYEPEMADEPIEDVDDEPIVEENQYRHLKRMQSTQPPDVRRKQEKRL